MNRPLNMPIAPSATVKHKLAWKRQENFDLDATVRIISSHNPWRPNAYGYRFFEIVLRPKPITTVREILADAANLIGYQSTDVMSKLKWLYTWGDFIEVDGQRHFPKQEPLPEDKEI